MVELPDDQNSSDGCTCGGRPDEIGGAAHRLGCGEVPVNSSDEAIEAAARAMALVDEENGCFERVAEWEAMEPWEQESEGEPHNDREDCEYWRKRARAAEPIIAARVRAEARAEPAQTAGELWPPAGSYHWRCAEALLKLTRRDEWRSWGLRRQDAEITKLAEALSRVIPEGDVGRHVARHLAAVRAEAVAAERQRIVSEIEGWYRTAFAEFERAAAAEAASDYLGRQAAVANRRRAFAVMDTWCQAWSAAKAAPPVSTGQSGNETACFCYAGGLLPAHRRGIAGCAWAAGSVPVATPALTVDEVRSAAEALLRWCDDDLASPTVLGSILAGLRGPVATPPVKLTCEHRRDVAHSVDPTPAQMFWREYPPYCPGPVATPTGSGDGCPDGGTCHHSCTEDGTGCFRVRHCGPLSGVYPGDEWPAEVRSDAAEPASLVKPCPDCGWQAINPDCAWCSAVEASPVSAEQPEER